MQQHGHNTFIVHNTKYNLYTNVQSSSEINRELENGREKNYYNGITLFYQFVERRDLPENNYFIPFQRF